MTAHLRFLIFWAILTGKILCFGGRYTMKQKRSHPILRVIMLSFLIAALLSAAVMLAADDAFALIGREADEVTVVIPEEADGDAVSEILGENGLIRFPFLYRIYGAFREWNDNYLTGEFTLTRAMSYDELRYTLAPKKGVRLQQRVTIPEGFTTDEIIDLFVSEGIGTKEGFADAIGNGDFGYDFLSEIPAREGRAYRLDGYLFPDTYFVYTDSTEMEIISKLLANFNRKFDKTLRNEAKRLGYTVDEIVNIASVIQSEAYYRSDMSGISSVFHNRLENRSYPYLQSDATVKYAKEVLGDMTPLTADDLDTLDSPYNTYQNQGLPPGAICSPGKDAIMAAIYPGDTNYYYFVSAKDKSTIFSRTYAEHLRAVASLRS